jgi:hypothetical protein
MEQLEERLMWAVQALAQPAELQPRLFPEFVVVADELALEFDHWQQTAKDHVGAGWSETQHTTLTDLDRLLTEMSGPGHPELWRGADCLNHPTWAEVRVRARTVLAAFGWSSDAPPADRAVYVPGSRAGEPKPSGSPAVSPLND